MNRFENKIALVTGAASGIGRATVERIATEGGHVACLDRNGEVEATVARVEELGGKGLALVCDVTDEQAVKDAVAKTVEHFERLDVLCNIAGILRADHTHELELDAWNTILNVNLTGTFLMCREAIPHLLKTKGCIVNTSSTAALGAHPWMAAYAASKGGIISLTKTLAAEYVKQGLRANCVCPGGVVTPLHGQFSVPKDADPELLRRAMPLMKYAEAKDAAAVIAFLASEDASFMTGSMVRCDGGALS